LRLVLAAPGVLLTGPHGYSGTQLLRQHIYAGIPDGNKVRGAPADKINNSWTVWSINDKYGWEKMKIWSTKSSENPKIDKNEITGFLQGGKDVSMIGE